MTDSALSVLSCLFTSIWSLFTSWYIPGTNVTPAAMGLFLISAVLGLSFAKKFLHSSRGGGSKE